MLLETGNVLHPLSLQGEILNQLTSKNVIRYPSKILSHFCVGSVIHNFLFSPNGNE